MRKGSIFMLVAGTASSLATPGTASAQVTGSTVEVGGELRPSCSRLFQEK